MTTIVQWLQRGDHLFDKESDFYYSRTALQHFHCRLLLRSNLRVRPS